LATTDSHVLPYHHFSLVMNKQRRLAYFTAVNIDGKLEKSIRRKDFNDRWFLDPRLENAEQLQNDLYAKNDLDRGHLVRRLDPVWGASFADAKLAHDDSFHWTNSSPQHKDLNRNDTTWGLVEDFILRNAQAADQRVTVFTGPVFREDDPIYETRTKKQRIPIPRAFWKVIAMVSQDRELKATAFLLKQDSLIAPLVEAIALPKQFQKSVRDIEQLTGISFHHLADHDPLSQGAEESVGSATVELTSLEDLVWE
jgi:endonuclease G